MDDLDETPALQDLGYLFVLQKVRQLNEDTNIFESQQIMLLSMKVQDSE
jgi:hypothetical protein